MKEPVSVSQVEEKVAVSANEEPIMDKGSVGEKSNEELSIGSLNSNGSSVKIKSLGSQSGPIQVKTSVEQPLSMNKNENSDNENSLGSLESNRNGSQQKAEEQEQNENSANENSLGSLESNRNGSQQKAEEQEQNENSDNENSLGSLESNEMEVNKRLRNLKNL